LPLKDGILDDRLQRRANFFKLRFVWFFFLWEAFKKTQSEGESQPVASFYKNLSSGKGNFKGLFSLTTPSDMKKSIFGFWIYYIKDNRFVNTKKRL